MIYIVEYNKFIDTNTLPKGTILYHGTIEKITLPLKTGAYDDIFWTAKDLEIARMYIPTSTSTVHTSLDLLINPKYQYIIENILRPLGIIYKDITYDSNGNIISYKTPDVYRDIEDAYEKNNDESFKLYTEIQAIKKEYYALEKATKKLTTSDEIDSHQEEFDKMDVLLDKWGELEDKLIEVDKHRVDKDKLKKEIVRKKLQELGYDGKNGGDYKLKFDGKKLIRFDENVVGKVYKLSLKRDMSFYDYAKGREGDLTDLDYHKLGMFRKAKSEGFDGIRINDFAQSDHYGNYGHISYGFFADKIKDLEIVEVFDATHPKKEELE